MVNWRNQPIALKNPFRVGRWVQSGQPQGRTVLRLRFLENHTDYLEEAEYGVLSTVLKLFLDFVEGEHAVGVIEENAPLAFLFLPRTSVGVNHAFAEIGTEDLDELCSSGSITVSSASLSFNESVKPFYGLVVVAELRF